MTTSTTLSVFSLNLRFGLAGDAGPHSWERRKAVLPELLAAHSADFMAFQEVNDFQADFLRNILSGYAHIGRRNPAPKFWQNNMIFFRREWECLDADYFFLSPTPDIPSRFVDSRWPRQCIMGRFRKDGGEVVCVTTHFDFQEHVQTESARLILRRLRQYPEEMPALIVGDFNATPEGACFKLFTGQGEAGRREGQNESAANFRSAFSPPFPATFHDFTGERDGVHIDWILSRHLVAMGHGKAIQAPVGDIYPSDHFPVRASFRMPE